MNITIAPFGFTIKADSLDDAVSLGRLKEQMESRQCQDLVYLANGVFELHHTITEPELKRAKR